MMKSMYDWALYHVAEGINPEEHVIATYLIEKEPEVDVLNYACSIAIEQSTGTWVPVPEEMPAVRQKHAGKVVGIYEIPHYEFELPAGLQSRTFVINIAFPYVNFGTQDTHATQYGHWEYLYDGSTEAPGSPFPSLLCSGIITFSY